MCAIMRVSLSVFVLLSRACAGPDGGDDCAACKDPSNFGDILTLISDGEIFKKNKKISSVRGWVNSSLGKFPFG